MTSSQLGIESYKICTLRNHNNPVSCHTYETLRTRNNFEVLVSRPIMLALRPQTAHSYQNQSRIKYRASSRNLPRLGVDAHDLKPRRLTGQRETLHAIYIGNEYQRRKNIAARNVTPKPQGAVQIKSVRLVFSVWVHRALMMRDRDHGVARDRQRSVTIVGSD